MIQQQSDSNRLIKYVCEYEYQGFKWDAEIEASSFDDAVARLRCLGGGKVNGELICSIHIPVNENLVSKLMARIKRLIAGG